MRRRQGDSLSYFVGFMISVVVHLSGAVIAVAMLEKGDARALRAPEVFTVTLEGGEVIGGLSQVPTEEEKKKKVLPAVPEEKKAPEPEEKAEKKEITGPTVVEDPEKLLKEKKAKEEAERKKKEAESKKKKAEEKKKKKKAAEEAKKRKAEEAKKKKKAKEQARKKKEQDKKKRKEDFRKSIENARKRYDGESANAGGRGFGAAKLGGKGMGGGTLASVEFIAYRNALERHIKDGWHWLPTSKVLQAQVMVKVLPDGTIQNATIVHSSGARNFDDSIIRAVYKASPVPPAPPDLYGRFREVRITFDSHN